MIVFPEPPVSPAPHHQNSGLKWFIVIVLGLILITGILIVAFYINHTANTQGVTVVRMEGTLKTGDVSDDESAGSVRRYHWCQLSDCGNNQYVHLDGELHWVNSNRVDYQPASGVLAAR